jgi:hypothetical protein
MKNNNANYVAPLLSLSLSLAPRSLFPLVDFTVFFIHRHEIMAKPSRRKGEAIIASRLPVPKRK